MITSLSFPTRKDVNNGKSLSIENRRLGVGSGEIQYKGVSGSFVFGSVFSKPNVLFNSVILAWDDKGGVEARVLLNKHITLISKEHIEGIPQKIKNNSEYLPYFLEDSYVTLTPLANAGFKVYVHSRLRGGMPAKIEELGIVPNRDEIQAFESLISKGDIFFEGKNRNDAEVQYVEALEKIIKYNDISRRLLAIKKLAMLYSQLNSEQREKEDFLCAVGLYNYVHCLSTNEERQEIKKCLIEIEIKLLKSIGVTRFDEEALFHQLNENRMELESLQACKEIPSDQSPNTISDFQERITAQIMKFIRKLIEQTFSLMGSINFKYAIIGFGSLARKEATPYSDLEFGVLLKEDTKENREYFRDFTRLLHLKVINLGQTILPALNIPGLQRIRFYDDVIPRGFAFDGAGVQGKGHKTPLGCPRSFELIQTPKAMAQFQGIANDGKFWVEKEPHLPMELLLYTLIDGEKELVKDYQEEVSRVLSQPYKDMTMREWMAKHHLVKEDFTTFEPSLISVEKQGQMFLVKHDLYRLAHLLINRLALLQAIDVPDTFGQIERLRTNTLTRGADNLKNLVAIAQYFRLKTYADFGRQKEYMNPLLCYSDEKKLEMQTILKQLYRCLIPFVQGVKAVFSGANGSLSDNLFSDTSKFTEGLIAARLLNLEEATNCFNAALLEGAAGEKKLAILNMLGVVLYAKGDRACIEKFRNYLNELRNHPGVLNQLLSNFLAGLNNFANAQSRFATLNESVPLCNQAIDLANGYYGRESLKVVTHYNNRAEIFRQIGNLDEAKKDYEKVIAIYSEHQGTEKNNPERAVDYSNIGNLYLELNQLGLAEKYFKKAMEIHEIVYGHYHPNIANDLLNFCSLHIRRGEFPIALELSNKAKRMALHLLGQKSEIIVQADLKEGAIFMKLSEVKEAKVCFERALLLAKNMFHPNHFMVGDCLNSLGQLSAMEKSWKKAIDYYKEALSIFEREGKLNLVGVSKFNLGACNMQIDEVSEAHRLTDEALDLFSRIYKPEHLIFGMSIKKKGDIYLKEGNLVTAQEHFMKAITVYRNQDEIPDGLPECYYSSGEVAWKLGNKDLAKEQLCEAIKAAIAYYRNGERLGKWFQKVGLFFFHQNEFNDALLYLEKALEIFIECNAASILIGNTNSVLANTCLRLTPANKEKSIAHFTTALELLSPLLGEEHHFVQDMKRGLTRANALP
jgi:tetratricopeptide (TPR) repeat protein/predicted nucleotidyltransferase